LTKYHKNKDIFISKEEEEETLTLGIILRKLLISFRIIVFE